jgi:hypothetical protein
MLASSSPATGLSLAIVGATGAVGVELLGCLEARGFGGARVKLLASARSAGQVMAFAGRVLVIEELTEASFAGVDAALFSAGATVSRRFRAAAVAAGAVMIDNSSAFRMDADVPLVVPEVNGDALAWHSGVIANPNCVAAIMTVALAPPAPGAADPPGAGGDLSVGVGCRRGGHGGTARCNGGGAGRRAASAQSAAPPLCLQPVQPQCRDRNRGWS